MTMPVRPGPALPHHAALGPRTWTFVLLAVLIQLPRIAASASSNLSVRVVGNQLVSAAGDAIQLRGVDRSGSEFACTGTAGSDGWSILDTPSDVTDQASVAAMASWDINAVRLPLNEDCWLGINGVDPALSGANYRNAILDYVQLLNSYGMIAILDLHYNAPGTQVSDSTDGPYGIGQQAMADESHAPYFWSSVATTFVSDPGVIFDLYNEPFGISWSCWLDGGCDAPSIGGNPGGWPVAGMQSLVDAVRASGADQPIMVGGLDYANDLAQWLAYEPRDTLNQPQIIASVHAYEGEACSTDSCWDSTVAPVAAQVPVVAGEFGPSTCDGSFVDDFMDWSDAHGLSYLAWTWGATSEGWDCVGGPALLVNDDGTPDAYGAAVEAHYRAAASAALSTTPVPTTTTAIPVPSTTTVAPVPSSTAVTSEPSSTTVTTPVVMPATTTPTERDSPSAASIATVPVLLLTSRRLVENDGVVALSVTCKLAACAGTVQLVCLGFLEKKTGGRVVWDHVRELLASRRVRVEENHAAVLLLRLNSLGNRVLATGVDRPLALDLVVKLGTHVTVRVVGVDESHRMLTGAR